MPVPPSRIVRRPLGGLGDRPGLSRSAFRRGGWPIGWEDLAPSYRRARTICGLDGGPDPEPVLADLGITPPALRTDLLRTQACHHSPRISDALRVWKEGVR